VSFSSSIDGWAVGDSGTLLHWDGLTWLAAASPASANWRGVSAISGVAAWIVGDGATTGRYASPAYPAAAAGSEPSSGAMGDSAVSDVTVPLLPEPLALPPAAFVPPARIVNPGAVASWWLDGAFQQAQTGPFIHGGRIFMPLVLR
jgi:hypothetical protein